MPYDEEQINNMINMLDFDWDRYDKGNLNLEDDPFNYTIKVKVSKETFERWQELRERLNDINGYDNESKVLEFAIVETLNIPIESIR